MASTGKIRKTKATAGVSPRNLEDMSSEEFVESHMPIYHGPTVTLKVGAASYNVSKTLLCRRSSYFAAMFNGKFREAEVQSADLQELEGVVSTRSVQMLLRWLYTYHIKRANLSTLDWISAMIELSRLADMLDIKHIETQIAESIREAILQTYIQPTRLGRTLSQTEANMLSITSGHIDAVINLPKGHTVRKVLAQAAVDGYIHVHKFKFAKEIEAVPEFAADVLEQMREAFESFTSSSRATYYYDPFTEKSVQFRC